MSCVYVKFLCIYIYMLYKIHTCIYTERHSMLFTQFPYTILSSIVSCLYIAFLFLLFLTIYTGSFLCIPLIINLQIYITLSLLLSPYIQAFTLEHKKLFFEWKQQCHQVLRVITPKKPRSART